MPRSPYGADITYPYEVEIDDNEVEQIDAAIRTDRIYALVESKHHAARVDVVPIAKLRFMLGRRPLPTMGCLFSMSGFTVRAIQLVRYTPPLNILLWDGPQIERILRIRDQVVGTDIGEADRVEAKYEPRMVLKKYLGAGEIEGRPANLPRSDIELLRAQPRIRDIVAFLA